MIGHLRRHIKKDAIAAGGLLLLCLLWSFGWLRSDLLPSSSASDFPPMERLAIEYALLAVAATLFALASKAERPRWRQSRDAALVGLWLLVAPTLLVLISRQWISELTRAALFSLAPVFAVVFEPHIGRETGSGNKGGLIAALVAVLGTLCIFPMDLPRSFQAAAAFGAVILAAAWVASANCWAVQLATDLPRRSTAQMAAIAGASAALAFAAASALTEHAIWNWESLRPELAWSAAVDLPGLLLLFWLMRRMSAVRMTTRFVVAPLLANLIGLVLLRPSVSPRASLGLALIAAGSGWILFAGEDAQEESTLPLKLDRG